MCRCCSCLPFCCCVSSKTRRSFPINEKKSSDRSANVLNEANKVIVRPVQTVRLPIEPVKETTAKTTLKEKNKTKSVQRPSKVEAKSLRARTPLEILFDKMKPPVSASPVPISIHSVLDQERADEPPISTASDWPSTTVSDRFVEKKSSNVFSQVLGTQLARENLPQKRNISSLASKNNAEEVRKSKLVLKNVRKMIDDQQSTADPLSEMAQL